MHIPGGSLIFNISWVSVHLLASKPSIGNRPSAIMDPTSDTHSNASEVYKPTLSMSSKIKSSQSLQKVMESVARTCFVGPRLLGSNPRTMAGRCTRPIYSRCCVEVAVGLNGRTRLGTKNYACLYFNSRKLLPKAGREPPPP